MKSFQGMLIAGDAFTADPAEDYEALPEDFTPTREVKADVITLIEFEKSMPAMQSRLEEILEKQDAKGIVDFSAEIAPYVAVVQKYRARIPYAKKSLGKRIPLVDLVSNRCKSVAQKIADKFYDFFVARRNALESTDDLPKLEAIRAEMNAVASSYKFLQSNFASLLRNPEMDCYLARIPKIAALKKELDAIEGMLAEDQSKDNFAALREARRRVKGGLFAGQLMKEACRLDYREGRIRCARLGRQIDEYLSNFEEIQEELSRLREQNRILERTVKMIDLLQDAEPNHDSAKVLDIAKKLLHEVVYPESSKFAVLRQALSENNRLRKKLEERYTIFSTDMCEKAKQRASISDKLPEPQNLVELNKFLDFIQAAMPKLDGCVAVFSALGKFSDAENCRAKLAGLKLEFENRIKDRKKHAELEKCVSNTVQSLKEADSLFSNPDMLEIDLERIIALMNLPVVIFPDKPIFSPLKEAYESQLLSQWKKIKEKAAYGIEKVVEIYEQPIQKTGDAVADSFAIQSRLKRINEAILPELRKTFAKHLPIGRYEERLRNASQVLLSQLNFINEAQAQKKELERLVKLIKTALENLDNDALEGYAQWPAIALENVYTQSIAKEYCALVQHLKGVIGQTKNVVRIPRIAYLNDAFDISQFVHSKRFNLFSYIDKKMSVPKNPLLAKLRNDLLCGNIHERLAALEESLRKAVDTYVQPEDCKWLSELKAAYLRDASEGYLSNPEASSVNPDQVSRINSLFEKYVK